MSTSGRTELAELLRLVDSAQTDDFSQLVKLAKLNPNRHLRLADWSGVDFSGSDLRGFDFTGACLRGCNFEGALIEGARFDQAEIDHVRSDPNARSNIRRAKDWSTYFDKWQLPEQRQPLDYHLGIGTVFQDAPFSPELIVVPPGTFVRGSPADESGRHESEGPEEEVTIPMPFAVGRYAVTFDEWDAYANRAKLGRSPSDESWGRHRRPVINISWEDAKAYIAWLSEATGRSYRFLSETEFEYVSRAGRRTPYWWGDTVSTADANYNGRPEHNQPFHGINRGRTLKVNSFRPNPWGLYQVHGNVWQWTEDAWQRDYRKVPQDGTAWTGGDTSRRVLRGGSWMHSAEYLRAAARHEAMIDVCSHTIGLRVARSLHV